MESTTKKFKCNNAANDAIKWLEEHKAKIHDGGISAEIIITIVQDMKLACLHCRKVFDEERASVNLMDNLCCPWCGNSNLEYVQPRRKND